ncbi:DUF6765 family protein [Paraherbaspirillum soli]|uniref:DUF6765 family protein n=1 Tax=Paraherbaspirillum soli TaxID=631222 RepID=A0ABW0MBB5_9BURK
MTALTQKLFATLALLGTLLLSVAPAQADLPPGFGGGGGSNACDPTKQSCAPQPCSAADQLLGKCGSGTNPTTPPGGGTCSPSPGGQTCKSSTQPASLGNSSNTNQGAGNPINIINGNKYQQEVDLPALPGVLGLEIVRHYNSQYSLPNVPNGAFGRGWKLSYETELYVQTDTVQIVQADGTRIIFNRDAQHPSLCSSADPANGRLRIDKKGNGNEYVWTWPNGRQLDFNSDGQLVQIAAPSGEFVSLTRDAKGMLLKVTDPQGRSLRLNYLDNQSARAGDRFRGAQSIDSPVGRFEYAYGSAAPKGSTLDKTLLLANLVKVTIPTSYAANQKVHAYTERGISSSTISRSYHYEDPRFPTLLTGVSVDGSGSDGQQVHQRLSTWGYDQNGRGILSVKGSPAQWQKGADGKLLEPKRLVPGTGLEQVTFDRSPVNQVILTNSLGQRTSYRHAIIGGQYRLLEVRGAGCASCGQSNVRYGYDLLGRMTETTQLDDNGQPVAGDKTEYDAYGRTVRSGRIAYRDGKAQAVQWLIRYEYPTLEANAPEAQASTNPTLIARPSVIPGREAVTRIAYNAAGQVTQVSESGYAPALDGKDSELIERSTRYGYRTINGRSLLARIDGPLAHGPNNDPSDSDVTLIDYDQRGSFVTAITTPQNLVRRFTRDTGTGRLTRAIGVDGIATDYAYNTQGMLTRTARAGQVTERQYDALDQVSALSDGAGRGISLRYDGAGRPVRLQDAQGYFSQLSLDSEGHIQVSGLYEPAAEQGKLVRASYRSYDQHNRLASQLQPDGRLDTYGYDAQGRVVRHVDGDGVRHFSADNREQTARADIDLAADGMLRVNLQLVPPTSNKASSQAQPDIVRDDFGRILKIRLADYGNKTARYDVRDRMLELVQADGSRIAYRYDLAGRLTEKTTTAAGSAKAATVSMRYQGNRLIEITDPVQRTAYSYDAAGRIAQTRITLGEYSYTLATTYDARTGQPSTQRLADGREMQIERDPATQVARNIKLQGERMAAIAHRIDQLPSWLHWLKAALPQQTVVAGIGFHPYNGVTGYAQGNGIQTAKGFDIAGRLTSVKIGADRNSIADWRYDYGVGPRIRALQAANASGGIVKTGYDYTGFGALKPFAAARNPRNERDALGRIVDDGHYRYGYTPEGQIETVTDAKSGKPVATYRYNSFHQRVAKTVGSSTTYYLWQHNRLVAEVDQQGHISAQYLYLSEDGKATPVAKLESEAGKAERLLYIHADQRGAPVAMTDSEQKVVWQAEVSAWGDAKVQSKDGSTLNLRLPGQYYDAETGLHDNFHRTYNPATGRYLQPDPLGYVDGPDPYLYVQGDPVNKIDPLGLYQSDIHYYMTYFLAMAAGMDVNDARVMALAAQYVDDNPDTEPMNLSGGLDDSHRARLLSYHFTMVSSTVDSVTGRIKGGVSDYGSPTNSTDYINIPENDQLGRLYAAVSMSATESNLVNKRCTKLQFMGEYLHAFEDTFAHRDSNNHPFALDVGLGHGGYGSNPDYTYNHKAPLPFPGAFNWNHNEERTLEAEKEVFNKLTGLGDPSKAQKWSDIEQKLKDYNAIPEHEGHGFEPKNPSTSTKIQMLQSILQSWDTTRPDLKDINLSDPNKPNFMGYLASKGEENRMQYLCDKDGKPLSQTLYAGTILPTELECKK